MKNEGKIWNNKEIVFLQNNYPKYGSKHCADTLKRGRKAVAKRAQILKIKFEGTSFKYLKENIEKVIKESRNIIEIVRKLGLKAAGGNHKTIMTYIKKYNIDISHFETQAERIRRVNFNFQSIPLSEILINGSLYNRTHLKARLYKEGLKERKCEKCGQDENWRGEHMSLILDHKNGINNDNRLENLRIVCPNCNATFPTHSGKNNKKLLIKKEKLKGKNSIKINGVDGRRRVATERRVINRPSLEQLNNEISSFGYSATGRKYGVSDNAIRKWIKSYEKYGA